MGIAEEHAVTFAAGLAAGGMRPIVAIYSYLPAKSLRPDDCMMSVLAESAGGILPVDRSRTLWEVTERRIRVFLTYPFCRRCPDVSEKLFASDKSFLGNKSMRSHTNEGVEGRIFTQFIALIIRNKIYTALQEENEKLEKKQNYMTVPAAIRELEKIEMTRQTDNVYRLDHAVTAKQKKILEAFGMNEGNITYRAGEISNTLKKSNIQKERR